MSVFTKRNALVGYLALKAIKRRRRRATKIVALASLGLVSAGILAVLALVVLRRRDSHEEERSGEEAVDWTPGDPDSALSEPGFAA